MLSGQTMDIVDEIVIDDRNLYTQSSIHMQKKITPWMDFTCISSHSSQVSSLPLKYDAYSYYTSKQ